ncbi:hypothetical protein D9757_013547 [Collybiopsis confluens]|uniref:Uncharacterized protein n=1 Tax=Collybiopsis confluens TaxID=2823264 RepID=A0A8H5GAN4_9AGAR|nr:hypothetical protein D9757_013547 [Collybiopsis confluens]
MRMVGCRARRLGWMQLKTADRNSLDPERKNVRSLGTQILDDLNVPTSELECLLKDIFNVPFVYFFSVIIVMRQHSTRQVPSPGQYRVLPAAVCRFRISQESRNLASLHPPYLHPTLAQLILRVRALAVHLRHACKKGSYMIVGTIQFGSRKGTQTLTSPHPLLHGLSSLYPLANTLALRALRVRLHGVLSALIP